MIRKYPTHNRDSYLIFNATNSKEIKFNIEGKCIVEGYVNPGSARIISYSSGTIRGASVDFETVVECLLCNPVEGMLIDCVAKNITESSGIRAETNDEPSPVVIYIARDHYYKDNAYKECESQKYPCKKKYYY